MDSREGNPGAVTTRYRTPPTAILDLDLAAWRGRTGLDRVTPTLAGVAAAAVRMRSWNVFGYARSSDYARERLARSARWLRELSALGRVIERSPELALALTGDDGGAPLGRVAATIVARSAADGSMGEWIEVARNSTVAELKAQARNARSAARASPVADSPDEAVPAGSSQEDSSSDAPARRVRIPLPGPLRAAFDEVVVLSRSINGGEGTLSEFIECLIAENLSGPAPPGIESSTITGGPRRVDIEGMLARITKNWLCLSESRLPSGDMPELLRAQQLLERLQKVSAVAGQGDAVELDRQLRELISIEDELQRNLGELLEAMRARGAWSTLMFNGVGHYAEQRLGMGRRTAEERARLARLARKYSVIGAAYHEGRIGSEAALLIAKAVASVDGGPELEREWVAQAEQCSIKRLLDEIRVVGRQRWTVEDAPPGRPLDDDQWHRSLEQHPGTLHDRVARLALEAARLPEADMFLSLRLSDSLANDFLGSVEGRRRSIEQAVTAVPWDEPWPDEGASLAVLVGRLFSVRARQVPAWVGLLGILEEFVSTWDRLEASPKRRSDPVYSRDGWRCAAPGVYVAPQHRRPPHPVSLARG